MLSEFTPKLTGKPIVVVLSGAGISAESGIRTFRDANGLWEEHDIMTVASIEGWYSNPDLVLEFYNQRRAQAAEVKPNAGHRALVSLEEKYDVLVITQNVDDLHEQAGSTNVLHLHGLLRTVRSSAHPELIYDIGAKPIKKGDLCEKGFQLRPNIVWFGEDVPMYPVAAQLTALAEAFIVVGTSLAVYPAAGLLDYAPLEAAKFIVDPNIPNVGAMPRLEKIARTATEGLPLLAERLLRDGLA